MEIYMIQYTLKQLTVNLLIENHRKIISMSLSGKTNLLLKLICKAIKVYFSNKLMPQATQCDIFNFYR